MSWNNTDIAPEGERSWALSLSPKKNEWVKKVGKEGSLRMDGRGWRRKDDKSQKAQ